MAGGRPRIEKRREIISKLLPQVIGIANLDKEALGFLTEGAYRDAISHKRLHVMLAQDGGAEVVIGFILFGGVYPNARVQQIGVAPSHRRTGIASSLLSSLISDLEALSYLTVKASIASNLPGPLKFYAQNGFNHASTRSGGNARKRDIFVYMRELETQSLFSKVNPNPSAFTFGIRQVAEAPFYAFDLNVLFDLVRNRKRHEAAGRLFGAALNHKIRIAVASEFVSELRRTSANSAADPILQMALRLPRLPTIKPSELDLLSDEIHRLVFLEPQARGASTPQARSDARHLAHASIARASAFITSDGTILAASARILKRTGLDVASLDDFLDLIPSDQNNSPSRVQGSRFHATRISSEELAKHFARTNIPNSVVSKYQPRRLEEDTACEAIFEGDEIVAVRAMRGSTGTDPVQLLVHVRPDHLERNLLADYLLTSALRQACAEGPAALMLERLPGQSDVSQVAKARGFQQEADIHELVRVAIGRPITPARWQKTAEQIRRRTGLTLERQDHNTDIIITNSNGRQFELTPAQIETILGPTIIATNPSGGVIVPIAKNYADELLDTNDQLSFGFINRKDVAFLSTRGYVNSPRTAQNMTPGLPIFFYESQRTGGRSAIVAVGRIVNSVIASKGLIENDRKHLLAVDDVEEFSVTDDVLFTTFDNLLPFPNPVGLKALKRFGAAGANLITATPVSDVNAANILDAGWPDR